MFPSGSHLSRLTKNRPIGYLKAIGFYSDSLVVARRGEHGKEAAKSGRRPSIPGVHGNCGWSNRLPLEVCAAEAPEKSCGSDKQHTGIRVLLIPRCPAVGGHSRS